MLFSAQVPLLFLYSLGVYLALFLLYTVHYVNILYNDRFTELDTSNTVFDYIVVGLGSAGAVVAKRLVENKNTNVLVLEAGQYGNSFLDIPLLGLLLQNSPYDWKYTTVPQVNSCLSLNNNQSIWHMGKIVGGTGMLNNMVYVRGHQEDFDEWYKNKEGYNFETDVLPYFKKFEQWKRTDELQSTPLSNLPFISILPKFILNGAKQLGFSIIEDTQNCLRGFGMPKTLNNNGARWTPSHYLVGHNKGNVFIKTNSLVNRVLFRRNGMEAYGVGYTFSGRSRVAYASKGVILSAGVIGSPKILLHSGVGPKSHLDSVGIPTRVDLPVGENLQDHVTTGLDLILLNRSLGIGIKEMLSPLAAFDYFWRGSGPWTTGGCETLAFLDSTAPPRRPAASRPDLQFMVMPLGVSADGGRRLRHLVGLRDEAWLKYFAPLSATPTVSVLPVLLHPKSRGTVRLRDASFETPPLVDPAYLSHPDDVAGLVRGVEVAREVAESEAMRALGARLNENRFPGCEAYSFASKGYWECYVRRLTLTAFHPVGTCSMGAVVTYDFEVRGTGRLFVVDASVMPTLTSGNINGAILMLAEMASDRIKFKEYLGKGRCYLSEVFVEHRECLIF